MSHAILLGATIVSTSALVVAGVLAILMGLLRPRGPADHALDTSDGDAVFLFRDDRLVDCSDPAQQLLDTLDDASARPGSSSALPQLIRHLAPRFPRLSEELSELGARGEVTLQGEGPGAGLVLQARLIGDAVRLALYDTRAEGRLVAMDRLSYDSMCSEAETLRGALRHAPSLIWQRDAEGAVIWANARYIEAVQEARPDRELTWPLPDLFATAQAEPGDRLRLDTAAGPRWFGHKMFSHGARSLHYATPIDLAVQTEAARSETLQTLTRTFASLQIGLALFDAERRLQVFNPALVDLTGLDPLFLAARPSFEQVLYALREARMLPEPKDFSTWRREIVEMDRAAENGEYAVEWCLEGGRTYHVTGRPQPNGAIALFIEDISSEAALSRSHRTEIETMHNMLDGLPDGIITFSLSGQTLLANDAYSDMWHTAPCTALVDKGLSQAIGMWAAQCGQTTFWARLAEFATDSEARTRMSARLALRRGGQMTVTATRLRGGSLMVLFRSAEQALNSPHMPAPKSQQSARAAQAALISRPDPTALPTTGAVTPGLDMRTIGDAAPSDAAARKPRSARHSGSRLRAGAKV